ncbi:uncharacterized protein AC631_03908 [Debaryomyces fabryi]|uniref:Kinesin-like protein n=1 Tax=Debaryomyces fabryi TaxID=58627 RepID=A0A0V1PVR3_9ASCO|nr:uncharacterized protein AC631_03908 [Debaryomyces fabryi]KSA00343.1 hypothetical protein AC631_03908 [Debaryomyces fabryi]
MLGRLSQVEGNQLLRLLKLSKSIEQKNDEIAQLNTKIMTLKTQKANQEFENFKLDDEYMKWKEQVSSVSDDIDELKHHEQESLKTLQDKYELMSKQLNIAHEEKLQVLKEQISLLIEKVINENVYKYQSEKQQLSDKCEELSKLIKLQEQDLNRKLIKLKEEHNKKLIQLSSNMDETIASLQRDIDILSNETVSKTEEYEKLANNVSTGLDEANAQLNSQLHELKSKYHNKEMEISNLKNKISSMKTTSQHIERSFGDKSIRIDGFNRKAEIMNAQLASQEIARRVLHDKLQQLKGNIRVFCRIRPPQVVDNKRLDEESLISMDFNDDEFNDDASQELIISKDPIDENTGNGQSSYSLHQNKKNNMSYKFHFDKIFLPYLLNEDIFGELSQLIQSSLDGQNVCVFAYGQTGSGKTWTMSHPDTGMIPLSIQMIFDNIEELSMKGWSYSVEGQFLEIYNETIVDLLSPVGNSKKHEIKHDDVNDKTSVTNIATVKVVSKNQAKSILERATKNRSTASTRSNERSSRSHSIFILKMLGKNNETGEISEGTLNLIDLAGSERLNSSQAKGERLKETQAINKSLSCLGDVIYSLGQQQQSGQSQQHIPYRNSKLTYLLKHSLGGNSKTLMFVNISPLSKNFNETVNSLRFATKVNCTKIGSSKPNSR